MAINVNAILFRAAAECQSDEETRYYLKGVYVQPHPEQGVTLTGTDGHRLFCAHDTSGKCDGPVIVGVDLKALAAVKRDPKTTEAPRLTVDAEGHAIVGTYRSIKSAIIDGTYPDYLRILKPIVELAKPGTFAPASFNQKYVAGFGKIASVLSESDGKNVAIRIISFTDHDPALVRFGHVNHAFGVLMPMRSGASNEFPAFMQTILAPPPPVAEPAPEPAPTPEPAAKAKAKPKTSARKKTVKRPAARKAKKKTVKRKAA